MKRVEVERLFGTYDHCIDLNTDERVTLLHGANGVGKTTTLRMIDAFMRNDMSIFRDVEFERVQLAFVNGSTLELRKSTTDGQDEEAVVTLKQPLRQTSNHARQSRA